VLPVILIVENRPPTPEDVVIIRQASPECVKRDQAETLPSFDFENLTAQQIPYPNVFTPDGRIMTRVTPERYAVLEKLWRCGTLRDAAKRYWVRIARGDGKQATDVQPPRLVDWKEEVMITAGIELRGQKAYMPGGHPVYKGENIVAGEIQGDPVERDFDLSGIDKNSLWAFPDILPHRGFAIPQVAHCPNAAPFDPANATFTNTVTLLFPREDLQEFPFDLLFMSHIYIFFAALAARMGVLRLCRSHIYPTNLGYLPWTDMLVEARADIELLRGPLTEACHARFRKQAALDEALSALPLSTLKSHLQNDPAARLVWGECFDAADFETTISAPTLEERGEGEYAIFLSEDRTEWIELTRKDIAEGLVLALAQHAGESLGKSNIINMPVPVDHREKSDWLKILSAFDEKNTEAEMEERLASLDKLIGNAFGLSPEEIEFVRSECKKDPFLRQILPRYPGVVTRKHGFRKGLDSSNRYR